MVFQRRRQHERVVVAAGVLGVTAISAAALCVFLILACLTVLVPPLLDHPALPNPSDRPRRARRSSILLEHPVDTKRKVLGSEIFRVPSGGDVASSDLWESMRSKYFHGCSNASKEFQKVDAVTMPNRYLMISTSGGLNQQRTGIIDAVVVARILNATLVVPTLDQKSFWKDASNFVEVFDLEWFISSLSEDVKIVKELPKKGGKVVATPYRMRVPRKCTPRCYQNRVLPALLKKHVVHLTKFDYRLSNRLENNLQKLRCRVNYHALRFTEPIQKMGETLINRMRAKSKHFIALHLRFEPDMLAFSGCYYGGGDKERIDLGIIRKRWKNLHASNPDKERRHGRCPLTPEEVGLLLRALGYGNDVHIYVASGEVYGGEETLAPLKALFPNIHSKETLAKEELAPFLPFSSRMAALDYIVCDGSDVFVTNNNGNMAKMLAGRRRYFGHKRTIRPNAKKLYSVYSNRTTIAWDAFESKIRTFQKGFMGEPNEVRPGRGEFHENPTTCLCEATAEGVVSPNIQPKIEPRTAKGSNLSKPDSESGDEEQDWDDWDYGETTPLGKVSRNRTDMEDDLFLRSEDPDLEFFSD